MLHTVCKVERFVLTIIKGRKEDYYYYYYYYQHAHATDHKTALMLKATICFATAE